MINDQLRTQLESEDGYSELTELPGRGICGVTRFAFTTAVVYGIDCTGYRGRYCFHEKTEAITALRNWDGVEDPDGNWIKHKGYVEYSNPHYQKD